MRHLIQATEQLAQGVNKLHEDGQTKSLLTLVKRQAEEIDRRGQLVIKMEETVRLQKENIEKLLIQNKHLESMIESLRTEREKLLEEMSSLKQKTAVKSRNTQRRKESNGTVVEAA